MSIDHFFESQLAVWPTAQNNYERLKQVLYRSIDFDGFQIRVQYNPDRILSTTAKIDSQSLKARACFLCKENMPQEQRSFDYNQILDIRVNPYPIFSRHFTIPAKKHSLQLIEGHFNHMLNIAQTYPEYTIFYNGPHSGASAPDHFHFQLAPHHSMPLETDVIHGAKETLFSSPDRTLVMESIKHYLRKNIILHATDRESLETTFTKVLAILGNIIPNAPEPMINLFAWYDQNEWWVVLFPRRQHRPWQYSAEGDEQILFSPGCVDFAGMVISPRKVDFDRFDVPLLTDLFGQLTLTDEQWKQFKNSVMDHFRFRDSNHIS